jgi:hypothetical protein
MKDLMQDTEPTAGRSADWPVAHLSTPSVKSRPLWYSTFCFASYAPLFPALSTHVKTQDDLDEFRRTWMLAFAENGITTMAQVNAECDCPPAGNADPVAGSVCCLVQGGACG